MGLAVRTGKWKKRKPKDNNKGLNLKDTGKTLYVLHFIVVVVVVIIIIKSLEWLLSKELRTPGIYQTEEKRW